MHMKVDKEKVKVWIYTKNYRLNGFLHIMQGSRISDNLAFASRKSEFLPVTDCTIYFNDGTTKKTDFLLIQITAVVIIFEDKE